MLRHLRTPFLQYLRGYSSTAPRNLYAMNVVHFRRLPNCDRLQISFIYKNSLLNLDREFNFERNASESIEVFIERLKNNIQKEICKKSKKKKNKKEKAEEDQQESSAGTTSEEILIDVHFIKDGKKLEKISFIELLQDVQQSNVSKTLLKILNDEFKIVYNTPHVMNLKLPSAILAGYLVYPSKLELLFAKRELSHFEWFRALMPTSKNRDQMQWTPVGEGFTYKTNNNDIGYHLKVKCTPKNANESGTPAEYISMSDIQAGPGYCPFENRHLFTTNKLSANKFRVVTYNLLADLYADSDFSKSELFSYCPAYALNIDYRKQLFIKEIVGYKSDIICLQELDSKVFDLDLCPIFSTLNFEGNYVRKGNTAEGLGIFYDKSRFDLKKSHAINIGEIIPTSEVLQPLWEKIKQNSKLVQRIITKPTSLQIVIFQSKENGKFLLVANTHLYFHPDADHIRLLQSGFSMLFIKHIYDLTLKEYNIDSSNLSIIYCGDFNTVPECGIYKLMTEKFVGEDCIDWQSNEEEAVKSVSLSQPFNIKSACGCPIFTNFTPNFAECIDYIFYQTDNLQVDEVIPFPSTDELEAHVAIPSVVFPSDHIALVANFKWITK